MKTGKARRQSGFAYFGLLFSVTAAALAVSTGSHLLGNEARRQKELQLLNCGDAIRRAIESYHATNAAGMHPFPARLEWLIRDPHQPTVKRHLRRICVEPMQEHGLEGFKKMGGWALILDINNQIVGVHPESMRQPLKRSGFATPYEEFRNAQHYADWRFVAAGGMPAKTNPMATRASGNFIPSGGLTSPLLTPVQTAVPPPPPSAPSPALDLMPQPAPAATWPRAAAPANAPTPPPAASPAAPAAPAPEPTPTAATATAAPAALAAGAGTASGSGPPTPPEVPSGGVQPFVMRSPTGW